jgi:hypothetical protein
MGKPAPSLNKIILHDAARLIIIIIAGGLVDFLFKAFYIPIIGPPLWFSLTFENILFGVTLFLLVAATFDLLLSIVFYFQRRIRRRA